MRPVDYSFITFDVLGGDYERVCEVAGLDPTEDGWGLLHCVADDGTHITAVTDDPAYLLRLLEASGRSTLDGLEIPTSKVAMERRGWPDEWGD